MVDRRAESDGGRTGGLSPIAPKMLAETVVESIVQAAAQGHFLPGDRIVEAELARRLNVSRVPVREALRLLESQGVVENIPYRGMRLMQVTPDSMKSLRKVRLALEYLAASELQAAVPGAPRLLDPLLHCVENLRRAAGLGDTFHVAMHDIDFHRTLCRLTDNRALIQAWEPLARQLTIVVGLSTYLQDGLRTIVQEHEELLVVLHDGDAATLRPVMEAHILEVPDAVNYERLRGREGPAAGGWLTQGV